MEIHVLIHNMHIYMSGSSVQSDRADNQHQPIAKVIGIKGLAQEPNGDTLTTAKEHEAMTFQIWS